MSTDNVTTVEEGVTADEMQAETSTGLEPNLAGALSYLLGFVTGLVFYLVEKENEYVRFHAAQSMLLSGAVVVLSVLTTVLSTVLFVGDAFISGGIFAALVSLVLSLFWLAFSVVLFGVWVYLMVRAYQGKRVRIPVVAKYADRMA